MKKLIKNLSGRCPKVLCALPVVLLINGGFAIRAADAANGISDAEIRDVITRVAKHQIHALADGDYTAVKSIEEAKAAKAPEGLGWSYPWGVTLFGMLRSTDVTGDKAVDKFVVEHDLACARYYS